MSIQEKVAELAKTNCDAALALAAKIDSRRERAQSLGWVLRFAPAARTLTIFESACDAADEETDEYQRAIGMACPLRAMIEIGHGAKIKTRFRATMERIPMIDPIASRAEALLMLLQSVLPGPPTFMQSIVGGLIRECGKSDHWRSIRTLQDAALIVNRCDQKLAMQIALAIPSPNKRETTVKRLESGEWRAVRPFFW